MAMSVTWIAHGAQVVEVVGASRPRSALHPITPGDRVSSLSTAI